MTDLRYPIGGPELPENIDMTLIQSWIADVTAAPALLKQAVADLNEEQLDTPYRSEGWTLRQVVHHLPDSHMNTYLTFRTALTEDNPEIRSTDVDASGKLQDAKTADIHMSLDLFTALHARWVILLNSLNQQDFERTVQSSRGTRPLWVLLGIYAWHGKHHVAHIQSLRQRMGW